MAIRTKINTRQTAKIVYNIQHMFKLNAVRLTLIYVLFVSILLGLEIAKK